MKLCKPFIADFGDGNMFTQNVRRHNKWFKTYLPSYLKPFPEVEEDAKNELNERVVDELCKVSYKCCCGIFASISITG